MKNINIQNEANIKAEGKVNSKHCKPVICIETGAVYTSVTDAAEAIGCYAPDMSAHLTGKKRAIKGKHFCYLSRVNESLDAIVTRLRETASIEEDAKRWQAYQAEQAAIRKAEEDRIAAERKAEEERQAAIAKARAKVEKLDEKCSEYEAKWHATMAARTEAERELEALLDENEQTTFAA